MMAKTGTINQPAAMTKVMAEQAAFAISCPARNAFAYLTEEDNAAAANFQHGMVTTKNPTIAAIIMAIPTPLKNNSVATPAGVSILSYFFFLSYGILPSYSCVCLYIFNIRKNTILIFAKNLKQSFLVQ